MRNAICRARVFQSQPRALARRYADFHDGQCSCLRDGLVTVLTTPALAQHAFFWIPAVMVSSFLFSPPLAWFIAPMLMKRFIHPGAPDTLTPSLARLPVARRAGILLHGQQNIATGC
jgi:hypothetical protein